MAKYSFVAVSRFTKVQGHVDATNAPEAKAKAKAEAKLHEEFGSERWDVTVVRLSGPDPAPAAEAVERVLND